MLCPMEDSLALLPAACAPLHGGTTCPMGANPGRGFSSPGTLGPGGPLLGLPWGRGLQQGSDIPRELNSALAGVKTAGPESPRWGRFCAW